MKVNVKYSKVIKAVIEAPHMAAAIAHAQKTAASYPDNECKVLSITVDGYVEKPEKERISKMEQPVEEMRKQIDKRLPRKPDLGNPFGGDVA